MAISILEVGIIPLRKRTIIVRSIEEHTFLYIPATIHGVMIYVNAVETLETTAQM